MDTQQVISPSRAPSGGGIVHVNVRHASHFTVVGNHLAQHRELSLTAIGLATHIQSLPAGAKIGIKCLVQRFPESETRIAGALRELETHGYLKRTRERLPNGRIATRTTSYNQPPGLTVTRTTRPARAVELCEVQTPATPPNPTHPAPAPAPKPPPPPLPRPETPALDLHRIATALLLRLHEDVKEIVLSEDNIRTLAPAVATWLERGATPASIGQALTSDLPAPLKYPPKFLAHRLTALLPAPLPAAGRSPLYDPLQNCDGCDRAFRAPAPGNCAECNWELSATA
ncbi:helix-turn-helix domain-containing protein [Streptomyces sp. NBC_01257]|uniref:helix-turn-helix domain-containing protein n=1 Tax=Streptomyces sp. NBC_01257 TaxID=2903799 RepID=UPI002DDC0D59|nr:helix-turn-helix domain-containing protein [Streptomyces sp. NBC_01257]WRZ66738.1 helix-turn-helix domain-containing protein [Streptomyces sp. NBC_01257]